MYRIVGADGREYGPISADQVRQWVAEGRANAQTRVLVEGATEWKTLGELPEFASPPPGVSAVPPPMAPISMASPAADAVDQVTGPAIGLIVVAILNILLQVVALVLHSFFVALAARQTESMPALFSGSFSIAGQLFNVVLSVLILFGGIKMRKLENHGLAMTASIVAMLPCSLCCLVGLPIGIWSVIVLSKPEIKAAFR